MIALVPGALGSHNDLVHFTDWLNSLSPCIRFTVKHSDKQLEVLDTLLCIINNRIESKVYSKPTDGHMYLLPQSSHYTSMHLHISFGVAHRIRRICSREDWFEEQLLEYKQYFKLRNKKSCVIHKGFDKARSIPRCNFALILNYLPNFNGLPSLIRDHLKILFESPCMRKVFRQDKTCIRTGFHKTKNLKDMLVKSSVQTVTTPQIDNQVVSNAITRFVMLIKTFYFPTDVLLVLLQVKVIKLDNTCLVGLILSSIALFVKNVIDSMSVQPLILDAVRPTIRAT